MGINSVSFGSVFRFETALERDDMRARRLRKNIPTAYVSEALLKNPIGETYRIGNYLINDDCGYAPPDGAPGYGFSARDAKTVGPLLEKLQDLIGLYMATTQPAAYVREQQALTGVTSPLSPEGQAAVANTLAAEAKKEAEDTARQVRDYIAESRVRKLPKFGAVYRAEGAMKPVYQAITQAEATRRKQAIPTVRISESYLDLPGTATAEPGSQVEYLFTATDAVKIKPLTDKLRRLSEIVRGLSPETGWSSPLTGQLKDVLTGKPPSADAWFSILSPAREAEWQETLRRVASDEFEETAAAIRALIGASRVKKLDFEA